MTADVLTFPSRGLLPHEKLGQIVEVVGFGNAVDKKLDHERRTRHHLAALPAQPRHSGRAKKCAGFSVGKALVSLPSVHFRGCALHTEARNTTRYFLTSACNVVRSCQVATNVLPFVRMEDMPNRILELRRAAGLSQEELAFRIGVSKMQISGMERGKRELTLTMMRKLADALGVDTVDILGVTDNPSVLDEGARRIVARYNSAGKEQRANIDRVTEALAPLTKRDRDAA